MDLKRSVRLKLSTVKEKEPIINIQIFIKSLGYISVLIISRPKIVTERGFWVFEVGFDFSLWTERWKFSDEHTMCFLRLVFCLYHHKRYNS